MKAIITSGGKQYIVAEKDQILVDKLDEGTKDLNFDALAVIDGDKTKIGTPNVTGVKVAAKVVDELVKGDKVQAIRFKAKKRVNKKIGQRHQYSRLEIISIK